MDELTPKQKTELRQALERLQNELEQSIEEAGEGAKTVELDGSIGRVTRIDAIQQQSMAKANRAASKRRLELVKAALKALEQDQYGDCQSCGELIPYPRLLAKPEGQLCVECQAAMEQGR